MAVSATQAASTYQAPPSQLLAGKTPLAVTGAEAEAAAAEAATPAVNPNQQLYDTLKADLESQGPVGGSRSYRTKGNGDVVIINSQRTIIPKTGNHTVDKLSREITPTVDTTTSVVKDFFNAVGRGALYGAITGGIIGVMTNLTRTITAPNRKNFGRMAAWAISLSVFGALISALFQGVKAGINGSKKVTSSAYDALHGLRKKSPESK